MDKFTQFDYEVALAVLRQVETKIATNSRGHYRLNISSFKDDPNLKCFNALRNLQFHENFSFLSDFCFIQAEFFVKGSRSPFYTMRIGEKSSEVMYTGDLSEPELLRFSSFATFQGLSAEGFCPFDNCKRAICNLIERINKIASNNLVVKAK